MIRFCLIGPTYPYRGGIAHYTTLLAQQLRETHETLLISFSHQYPSWLFPGRSDRDPSKYPLKSEAEYLLNPLSPASWRRTLRRIRVWRADVVIIPWWVPFWAPAWMFLGRAIKRLPSKPRLIFICHNVLPHEQGVIGSAILPHIVRLVLRPGDRYIVHSRTDHELLFRYFPEADIQVTPHPTYRALGAGHAAPLPVDLPEDRPLLLFCGFVRRYKGLDILLDAMPLVLAKRPVHLLVAGEFWQGSVTEYREQIQRLGLSDAVSIIDEYLPDEVLATAIARADVVVLPYRSATQSGVIQIAFGQGKPVITTSVGGLAEVVEDGRTGLVVPPEDPAALAMAIDRYFEEGLETRLADNIRGLRARFSWGVLLDTILRPRS